MDDGEDGPAALALAYEDVRSAFRRFLDEHNAGRPFIVAGHSQGSHHLERLVEEEIVGSEADARLVGVWPVGFYLDRARWESRMPTVPVCRAPGQTRCVTTWNAVGPEVRRFGNAAGSICVNPLSGRDDGEIAGFDANDGALPFADDGPLPTLLPGVADARCDDGLLRVSEIRAEGFAERPLGPDNYHIYDYALFWAPMRTLVAEQVETWLASRPPAPVETAAAQ